MSLANLLDWKKYRHIILEKQFFEDVYIENKKLKENILEWIFSLEDKKKISINKFSDLFSKFEGIVFPIKVSGIPRYLLIEDFSGKEYYMRYFNYFDNKRDYFIGRRAYPTDTDFVYFLTESNEIILKKMGIMQLNEDDTNTDNMLSFNYNPAKARTKAVLCNKTLSLEIDYPSQDLSYDKELAAYLLDETIHCTYIDNVYSVFAHMASKFEQLNSLTITSFMLIDNSKELLSEICLSDGIVKKHSFTARPSDSQIILTKNFLSKNLKDFLSSHNH